MVLLKYLGSKVYRGIDPKVGCVVVVAPGGQVAVSEAKAAQLMRDFPGQWETVERQSGKTERPKRQKMRRPSRNK